MESPAPMTGTSAVFELTDDAGDRGQVVGLEDGDEIGVVDNPDRTDGTGD